MIKVISAGSYSIKGAAGKMGKWIRSVSAIVAKQEDDLHIAFLLLRGGAAK